MNYDNVLKNTKRELKNIFETYLGLDEEQTKGNSFIYVSTDNTPYTVEIEKEEDGNLEFYVKDKNNQLLDIFKQEMLDKNGGIPATLRKEIFNDYKTKHENRSGEEQKV
jgi:hypothetical protein